MTTLKLFVKWLVYHNSDDLINRAANSTQVLEYYKPILICRLFIRLTISSAIILQAITDLWLAMIVATVAFAISFYHVNDFHMMAFVKLTCHAIVSSFLNLGIITPLLFLLGLSRLLSSDGVAARVMHKLNPILRTTSGGYVDMRFAHKPIVLNGNAQKHIDSWSMFVNPLSAQRRLATKPNGKMTVEILKMLVKCRAITKDVFEEQLEKIKQDAVESMRPSSPPCTPRVRLENIESPDRAPYDPPMVDYSKLPDWPKHHLVRDRVTAVEAMTWAEQMKGGKGFPGPRLLGKLKSKVTKPLDDVKHGNKTKVSKTEPTTTVNTAPEIPDSPAKTEKTGDTIRQRAIKGVIQMKKHLKTARKTNSPSKIFDAIPSTNLENQSLQPTESVMEGEAPTTTEQEPNVKSTINNNWVIANPNGPKTNVIEEEIEEPAVEEEEEKVEEGMPPLSNEDSSISSNEETKPNIVVEDDDSIDRKIENIVREETSVSTQRWGDQSDSSDDQETSTPDPPKIHRIATKGVSIKEVDLSTCVSKPEVKLSEMAANPTTWINDDDRKIVVQYGTGNLWWKKQHAIKSDLIYKTSGKESKYITGCKTKARYMNVGLHSIFRDGVIADRLCDPGHHQFNSEMIKRMHCFGLLKVFTDAGEYRHKGIVSKGIPVYFGNGLCRRGYREDLKGKITHDFNLPNPRYT
jgi:hypothetical protein